MADDWRLTVDFDDEHDGAQLTERLDARRFEHDERHRFGERIVVSRDGGRVFFYADSESDARAVEEVAREDLASSGKPVSVTLERWHPVEEEWRDPAVPFPTSAEEIDAAEQRRMARETAESAESGHAEWEVRVELPEHEQAVDLADRLEGEGIPVVRRHTFVLVGAVNEDEAQELAKRLTAEAPEGATVHVQPGGEMVWEVTPQNPFVNVLGGLGG